MGSILAIVSKAIFEAARDASGAKLEPGKRYPTDRYSSTHKSLDPLGEGGDLFLVTARPGDELWLVARLVAPKKKSDHWASASNAVPVTDITKLVGKLRFENGKGIQAKPGTLGMSLQTPRLLSAADVALLDAALGGKGAAPAKPAPAQPAAAKPAAAKAAAAKPAATKSEPAKSAPPKSAPAKSAPAKSASARSATAKSALEEPAASAPQPVEGDVPAVRGAKGTLLHACSRALAEHAAGKSAAALAAIVDAWKLTPATELVEVADALSLRAESAAAKALRAAPKNVADAAWDAVHAAGGIEDRGALAATLHRAQLDSIHRRALALVALPPDPRLASMLHRLLLDPPFRATSSQPVWTQLFDYVYRHPDPRTLAVAREVAAGAFPAGESMQKWAAAKLAATEKKLVAAGADAKVLDAESAEAIASLRARLGLDAPVVAASIEARATAAAALPAEVAMGATSVFACNQAHEMRVSPSGATLTVVVTDPSERVGMYGPPPRTLAVAVVDLGTGETIRIVRTARTRRVFAVDPGDRILALAGPTDVHLVSLEASAPVRVVPVLAGHPGTRELVTDAEELEATERITAATFSSDGRVLYAACLREPPQRGSRETSIVAIDVSTGAVRALVDHAAWGSPVMVDRLLASADGERLVVVTEGTIFVWDLVWNAFAQAFRYSRAWKAVASTERAASSLDTNDGIVGTSLLTGVDQTIFREPAIALDAARGSLLVRPASKVPRQRYGGPLRIVGEDGAEVKGAMARPDPDAAVAILGARGDTAWVAVDDAIHELAPGRDAPLRVVTLGSTHLEGIDLAPGVRMLRHGSTVRVERDGKPAETIVERDLVDAAALARDGSVLYLGVGKSLRAVSLHKKTKPVSWSGHTYELTGLVAAASGAVVSASRDQTIIVWGADGKPRHRIVDHRAPVLGLAIDPSGTRIASVGEDQKVRLFDVASGKGVAVIEAPGARGLLAFAADGVHLAWSSAGGVTIAEGSSVVKEVATPEVSAIASHPTRPLWAFGTADRDVRGLLPDGGAGLLVGGLACAAGALRFTESGDRLLVGAGTTDRVGALTELALGWGDR